MAFDRPIEADRVDDLGLLSSFVRAPVVGTLMWIFGGSEARKLELEDKDCDQQPLTLLESVSEEEEPTDETHTGENYTDGEAEKRDQHRSRSLPHIASTDISENSETSGDRSPSPGRDEAYRDLNESGSSAAPALQSRLRSRSLSSGRTGKLKKKTSWSDEAGHRSLVEYIGESQSELHDPPSPSSDPYSSMKAVPVKPAIRQPSRSSTRSSHGAQVANSQPNPIMKSSALGPSERRGTRSTPIHPSQCIPSGLGPNSAGGGGIIMPTGGGMGGPKRRGSASGSNGGYVSPQWGWYISTTPPTPEMYNQHPSSQQQQKKWSLQSKSTVAPIDKPSPITMESQNEDFGHSPVSAAQPVFTKGVKGVGRTPGLGWPSVPL